MTPIRKLATLALALLLVLPPFLHGTGDLKWPEAIAQRVEEATGLMANDPVSALLTFKELIQKEKELKLKKEHLDYLEDQVRTLQPRALATLKGDYAVARQTRDLRSMIIIHAVAEKVVKGALGDPPDAKSLASEGKRFGATWRLKDATGEFISSPYRITEEKLTLEAKPGFRLLRVRATVENISNDGDKAYFLWALNEIERILMEFSKPQGSEPHRWLADAFIFALGSNLDLFPCALVVGHYGGKSRPTMHNFILKKKYLPPYFLRPNESIGIDVVFAVPNTERTVQLFVLGGSPVPIAFLKGQPESS